MALLPLTLWRSKACKRRRFFKIIETEIPLIRSDNMSEEMELEGEWVMGWPDRKRARVMPSKDSEGRTIFARSPVLDLEEF